jgi:hypothetical protein
VFAGAEVFGFWGASMSRPGRKRKQGARYPGGQRKRRSNEEKIEERVRLARNQPHRRSLRSNDRISELAESPLGRRRLQGDISELQYQAGCRYAVIVGEYRTILQGPKMTAGSGRALSCATLCAAAHELLDARQRGEVREGLLQACTCLDRKERYDAAFEAVLGAGVTYRNPQLIDGAWPETLKVAVARASGIAPARRDVGPDHAAARAVAKVVGRGEEPADEDLIHLIRGLDALTRHFGLTQRRAS